MSASESSSDAKVYVYCIARGEPFQNGAPPFQTKGIGGPDLPIYTLPFMDLVAVVSNSPESRYDIGRENTIAHQLVIEEAMSRSDILPIRFGTVAKNAGEVQDKLLRRKFGEFHHLLEYVRDHVELGLKVFWIRERFFAEIVAEDGRIRALRDAISGKPPEATHYQRIQLGKATEETIIRERDREAEEIIEPLRPLAAETKVNKVLTDMMVLNAAFLVERGKEREFDARVSTLDETERGRLVLKYAGPLPPYNFVNIVVYWGEE